MIKNNGFTVNLEGVESITFGHFIALQNFILNRIWYYNAGASKKTHKILKNPDQIKRPAKWVRVAKMNNMLVLRALETLTSLLSPKHIDRNSCYDNESGYYKIQTINDRGE